jgi:3-hydroxyisobutyrate dehydrogenase-like beta-hydroxyacid dehydrogenase
MHILATLDDVIASADVLVSVVLPDAAEGVARQCAERRHLVTSNCLFIEANSIDLNTLSTIEGVLTSAGIRLVDAAIHGGAARLEEQGVVYLSGVHAAEAEALFHPVLRVLCLGASMGQATRMKLLMAGQSKCLTVVFLQVAVLAAKAGMLKEFLAEARTFYPEIMAAIDRMLPTYSEHALRRVTELQNIECFARSVGAPHQILHAARDFLQTVAGGWNDAAGAKPPLPEIIELAALAASSPKEN